MDATKKIQLDLERRAHHGQESSGHSDNMRSETEWPKLKAWNVSMGIHLGMWYI